MHLTHGKRAEALCKLEACPTVCDWWFIAGDVLGFACGKMIPMHFRTKRNLSLFALTLLLAALAFAHAVPVTMVPAANSTVSAPANVTVHFSEELEPKFSKLTLSDAAGKVVSKAPSAVGTDAKMMTLPLPALGPGVYTVNWTSVALDSHREQGKYKFTIK
jgi:methionine-rich copper-binding protein CopC